MPGHRSLAHRLPRVAAQQLLAQTPQARFTVEEQSSDGSARDVVRWRYDWGDGHVRGVDIVQVRDGRLAESLAYVKG